MKLFEDQKDSIKLTSLVSQVIDQDTQEKITSKVLEQGLNRVVVASCTPRTHEPLFQETLISAGIVEPFDPAWMDHCALHG